MHLALSLPDQRAKRSTYKAHLGLESRAELCREQFKSHMGSHRFAYDGIFDAVSGRSRKERLVEDAFRMAKRYALAGETLIWAESLSNIEVHARDAIQAFLGGAESARPFGRDVDTQQAQEAANNLPLWVRQVNAMKTHTVGQVANSIKSALEQVLNQGARSFEQSASHVDFSCANDYHMVAVLRALRPYQRDLKSWPNLVAGTRKLVDRKGGNPEAVMKGLS